MGKKFMGYDNASELLTAIGTKIKAKYTKPDTGIPKSDLASAVQTSLDQISTNQTNILYNLRTGVVNLLDLSSAKMIVDSRLTVTKDGNDYVVSGDLSSESTIANVSFTLSEPITSPTGSKLVLSGCPSGGSTSNGYCIRGYSSGTWVISDVGSEAKESTSLAITEIKFAFTAGKNYTNIRFSPMLCLEEVWNQLHDYAPFARSNHELTKLESEDRAALAEVVDSGAKNEFIFGEFTSANSGSITMGTDSVTVSGTQAWAKGYRAFKLSKNTKYVLSFEISQNDSSAVSISVTNHPTNPVTVYSNLVFSNKETGKYSGVFTAPIDTNIYFIITVNNSSATLAEAKSITVSNIMMATKAACDVSPDYAPYRPSWDLVSTLFPTSYVAPAVNSNVSSKLSIICGGYAKMGNLVTINMRVTVSDTIPAGSQLFYNLPTVYTGTILSTGASVVACLIAFVSGSNGSNSAGAITYEGSNVPSALTIPMSGSALTAGTYVISATYLSA